MSLWSRIANAFRGDRLGREIEEEIAAHLREAVEEGRDPAEARRAFGPAVRCREASREIRLIPWLDSLRADIVFGWRQLRKRKVTSAAAILSLALAMGACTSAFRLIDALLLRPLPVTHPERLYDLSRRSFNPNGAPLVFDGWSHPAFLEMRSAVKDRADLVAVSYAERTDLTYGSDDAMEKAYAQYVSGGMFQALGLRPALGRLLTESDDLKPGAHPYAVISHDYWTRRFGRDAKAAGRTLRIGNDLYEIIGAGPEHFTGTEPGTMVDIFIPTAMHPQVNSTDNTWIRTLALMKPGYATEPVRQRLNAINLAFEQERSKRFTGWPTQNLEKFLHQTVMMEPSPAGVSGLQQDNRRSLLILAVLVGPVLLIACANAANLMTAQAAARNREMALRVSIGAGRARLFQLVLTESAMLAFFAASIGALLAWWSAPFVVSRINPADNPARLDLPADWSVAAFGLALTLCVMLLFGLTPALRASGVKPVSALKGGDDPRGSRRSMHALIAAQTAFCFLVLFVAGLFVATFERLSHRPTGFSAERILNLEIAVRKDQPETDWNRALEHLRSAPGVERAVLASWPLLADNGWNSFVSTSGGVPNRILSYFLGVSPGWIDEMKIRWIDGRDFRPGDAYPNVAIVNETFANQYFSGEDPAGKSFESQRSRFQVVGLVRDASYRNLREVMLPVAYVPFHAVGPDGAPKAISGGTFVVRTSSSHPLALARSLRQAVQQAAPGLRVANIRTQIEINREQTIRERLLAMLAMFFAVVALLLAGVGLYGVLDYSVLQRRREIGIRMALGARTGDVARRVTGDVLAMVAVGAAAGLALGMASQRHIEALLYEVKATDAGTIALPSLAILAVALAAAVPPMIRAVRIDPAQMLRME